MGTLPVLPKVSYHTIVATNLKYRRVNPGDEISLVLRSEREGIYEVCKHLQDLFIISLGFIPESIAVHPDHLVILQKQERSLKVTVTEEGGKLVGEMVDLLTLPTRIPLIADEGLDLFSAKARYSFDGENATRVIMETFKDILHARSGKD